MSRLSPPGDVIEAPSTRDTVEPVTPSGNGISGVSSATTPGAESASKVTSNMAVPTAEVSACVTLTMIVPLPSSGAVKVVEQACSVLFGVNEPPPSLDHLQTTPSALAGRGSPSWLNAIVHRTTGCPGETKMVPGTTITGISESKLARPTSESSESPDACGGTGKTGKEPPGPSGTVTTFAIKLCSTASPSASARSHCYRRKAEVDGRERQNRADQSGSDNFGIRRRGRVCQVVSVGIAEIS